MALLIYTNFSNAAIFDYIKLYYYIKKNKIDIAIGTNYKINIVLSFCRCKTIGTEHVAYEKYKKWQTALKKLFYKNLTYLVTLTKIDYERYAKWNNLNVIHIPNFIYLEQPFLQRNRRVRNFLAVGRLVEQKGFDLLIEALNIVAKSKHDFTCRIIGEGEDKESLQAKIHKYDLDENITIKDFMIHERLADEYKQADCFLLSSRHEGMPFVLLEALSFSLPVIAFDCPTGPSEIIESGKDGYLVEHNNYLKFAQQIISLMNLNESEILLMSKNAYEKSKQYSSTTVLNKWKSLLGEI